MEELYLKTFHGRDKVIKLYLMGLVHKWIARHKLRYIFSWISFALVSIIMVSFFSIGSSIKGYISKQLDVNPLSYQIYVRNLRSNVTGEEDLHDLDIDTVMNMYKSIGAGNMRILYDSSLYISKINDEEVDVSYGKTSYVDMQYPLLLDSDYEYYTYQYKADKDSGYEGSLLDSSSEQSAMVTNEFLQAYNLSGEDAIGAVLTFVDENYEEYRYQICGVLHYSKDSLGMAGAYIYLPYYGYTDGSSLPGLELSLITFELNKGTDLKSAMSTIASFGYSYASVLNNANYFDSLNKSFTYLGTIIGILLLGLISFGLMNSVLVTINENAPFMNFMRIMGLTKDKYRYTIVYSSILQGIIGGIIGCIASAIFQRQLYALINILDLQVVSFIDSFHVRFTDCLFVLIFCIIVSAITGLIAVTKTSKYITIHNINRF